MLNQYHLPAKTNVDKLIQAEAKTYQQDQHDPGIPVEAKIKGLVNQCFRIRSCIFTHMCLLNFAFLGPVYYQHERPYLVEQLKYLRRSCLGIKTFTCHLTFHDFRINDQAAELIVDEDHYIQFAAVWPQISVQKNRRHVLSLRRANSGWQIIADDCQDSWRQAAATAKMSPVEYLYHLKQFPPVDAATQLAPGGQPGAWRQLLPYDRMRAVAYAHQWALGRNPAYGDFSNWGGDCTNYASQAIHAGGPPLDPVGPYQWYYYNLNRRTPSWTGVDELSTYLMANNDYGPLAMVVPLEQAQPGDIVQLDFNAADGEYNHSPVIVAIQEPGNPARILVSAHTNDRDNYPLAGYPYQRFRVLHLTGFIA